MGLKKWEYKPLPDVVDIWDKNRQPINRKERLLRKQGKKQDELYPYYGATGLVDYIDSYLIDGEFVLLGEDGAPFLDAFSPKAYIINGKSWVNNHAHVLKSRYNNKFLCYYLNCFNYKGYVSGTTRLKLTQSDMKRIFVPVPPIKEQEKIVEQIEESLSQLDSAVATLNKTKQQLEIYRQAVLKEVFSSCDAVEIQYVCEHVTDGDHMPPPKSEQGIPFIMISNIVGNTIDWNGTAFVSKEYYDKIGDKRTPQKGDVLYTVTGSYGIPVLINFDTEFCFQRHIALLRPNKQISQEFLYYALQDSSVYSQASKRATGTAQKTVGLNVLRTIKIPYTDSLETQKKIVENIKTRLSLCDSIKKTVNQSLQQSEALRQSILKQAFEVDD